MNYTDEKIDLLANMLKELANVEISPEELANIKAKARDKDIEAKARDKEPWVDNDSGWYSETARQILGADLSDCTKIYEVTDLDKYVKQNCGIEIYAFTKKELEGMLNGKVYWAECNSGEYAHLFVMRKDGE